MSSITTTKLANLTGLLPSEIATIMQNETQCWQATDYANHLPLYFSQYFQIISSSLGIIILTITLSKTTKHLSLLDKFFRKLVYWACAFSILHNFFTIIIQGYHQISFHFFEDCGRMIIYWHCELLRGPQYFFSVGLCCVQVIMLLDRILASYKLELYESGRYNLPLIYFGIIVSVSFTFTMVVFSHDFTDQPRAYCSLTTKKTFLAIQNNYWILLGLNIFCCLGFFGLYFVNHANIQRKAHNFVLNNHFQLRNNVYSLTLAIPFMYSIFAINTASIIANNIIRAEIKFLENTDLAAKLEGVYFYTFHPWVISCALIWFTKRQATAKINPQTLMDSEEAGQAYFGILRKQWSI